MNNKFPDQNPRWSYSRFGTFQGCKLQYFYRYIKSFVVEGKTNEFAAKGLSVHEVLEWMNENKTLEECVGFMKTRVSANNVDIEKYPVLKSIPRIFAWWKKYISPFTQKGWTLEKEKWVSSKLGTADFCGALDSILINKETNDVIISDFKTPKNANVSLYRDQLILYAWVIGTLLKIEFRNIPDKIKLYVFFPLAGLDDNESTDEVLCEKNMMKNYKEVKYTHNDITELINKYEQYIKDSDSFDWGSIDGTQAKTSFTCQFCDYCGTLPDDKIGFYGCPVSREKGFIAKRNTKILTKKDRKEQKG